MRYKFLPVCVVLSAMAIGPGEASAKVQFQGAMIITAAAGTCTDYDPVGSRYGVRFRPGGIGDNPLDTGFSFFWYNGAYGITVPGSITGTFKDGTQSGIFDYADTGNIVKLKFTNQAPNPITVDTQSVNITGNMTNFDGMIGCTVTFRLPLLRRP